ncbi:hypothetical protein [Candidatus Nitrotoga sp. M5]|uniref:hypothetical protein n=1 Tax=Candidatus Nitrotoga sp. M5 TaxID=2890409 RepID=UPI001EF43A5E|nr:hypothetical protein [Candidatus Nitrotoga sp. M5]
MEWLPAIGDGIIQNGCFLDTRLRTIDPLLTFVSNLVGCGEFANRTYVLKNHQGKSVIKNPLVYHFL